MVDPMTKLFSCIATGLLLLMNSWCSAQQQGPGMRSIPHWGMAFDLAGDCEFIAESGKLSIVVPGSAKPHGLSPSLGSDKAPRVLQSVRGDFTVTVRVDGTFEPTKESTQRARIGYNGAGLLVMADERNFVRIERAGLHRPNGSEADFINFEMHVDGKLQRYGLPKDFPTDGSKPTWLRLERKGDVMLGSMSHDLETWHAGEPKKLIAEAWRNEEALVGVVAISNSRIPFRPSYSSLLIKRDNRSVVQDPSVKPVAKPASPGSRLRFIDRLRLRVRR
ncbi:hypothetical protein SV7mr_27770 [Stieleria bergensis]|uniref:3-keto-disaccharide hydrolase domain-containing protein n=2 Tax=Stieleria bergensis TaxID=2528025 RepID=A0A517SVU6_9BACT|nr:hypothetical protein SV7mr_27770 [Planctomycetes bacterium SV_7m_r]